METKCIISLEVPEALKQELRRAAFNANMSVSAYIRKALQESIQKDTAKKE